MLAGLERKYPAGLAWLDARLDDVEGGKAALDLAMLGNRIGALAIWTPKGPHRAKLSTFLVRPQLRGRGVGRALLQRLARHWRGKDFDRVAVTVNVADRATAAFFARNGFAALAGAEVRYDGDRWDRVMLWTPDARPAAVAKA